MLFKVYNSLLQHFGPQEWWPAHGGFKPREWEICIGAILTQNTSWKNVEKALTNLKAAKILTPKETAQIRLSQLAALIRPSGYFKQKAKRLKAFAKFALSFSSFNDFLNKVTREQLLQVNGIGRETADSILLYACNRPIFVVDAYTRRILSRIGIVDAKADYEEIRNRMENSSAREPKKVQLFNEYHALLVALGKNICKKEPLCKECPISDYCRYAKIVSPHLPASSSSTCLSAASSSPYVAQSASFSAAWAAS